MAGTSPDRGQHFLRNTGIGFLSLNVVGIGTATAVKTTLLHESLGHAFTDTLTFAGITDLLVLIPTVPVIVLAWLSKSKSDRFHDKHDNPRADEFLY